jgi:flagella basal body P-ring formation protein FlgA
MPRFFPSCRPVPMLPLLPLLACAALAGEARAQKGTPVATIALRASAQVDRGMVTLGDIAQVSGAGAPQVRKLQRLPLGEIGGEGAPVTLARERIARWVCVNGGLCGAALAWNGAGAVEIRRATAAVGGEGLVAVARAALERALAPLEAQLVIDEAGGQDKVELPRGKLSYAARPLPAGAAPARHMLVWVDVSAGGRFVRAVPVRFDVSARVPGWVARAPVAAGVQAAADQFEAGEVDLAEAGPAAVIRRRANSFAAEGEAWMVRQAIRPGQALTRKNSAPAPLVTRGQTATLHMQALAIALETRVEVLQDGFLGQTVKVKAMQATAAILATVAGPGLVETKN